MNPKTSSKYGKVHNSATFYTAIPRHPTFQVDNHHSLLHVKLILGFILFFSIFQHNITAVNNYLLKINDSYLLQTTL